MTTEIPLGTRVVVRYRLPAWATHPLTDVIGELLEHDPVTVRRANGTIVSVEVDRVLRVKAVPPRRVRPRDDH